MAVAPEFDRFGDTPAVPRDRGAGRSDYAWRVFRSEPTLRCLQKERADERSIRPPRAAIQRKILRRDMGPRRLPWRHVLVPGLTGGCLALALGLAWCLHDLPPVDVRKALVTAPSLTVLAKDGRVVAELGAAPGEEITADRLPKTLVAAVVATEDRRFFDHDGVDPAGIARAVVQDLRTGAFGQGGSTITQQLAKLLFLSPDRTLKRKIQELVLAAELERRYSKAEILALYLNRAYFGAGVTGADAAARRYFGKPVHDLDLAEAAVLAGALKAPSRYNLVSDRAAAVDRARTVLAGMVAAGVIVPRQAAAAAQRLAHLTARDRPAGGYFADWIAEHVRGMPETWGRSVVVTTTLDADLQRTAETQLAKLLETHGAAENIAQGAVVVMTPEGDIKAMVGGRDYARSPFNRATQAKRQPGSTFKIFTYLAALEDGAAVSDKVFDAPVQLGDWRPDNYLGRYWGAVTLETAFAQSLNSVAVRLAQRVGPAQIASVARRLGIESPLAGDATLALGTSAVDLLELTGAVATLAAGGRRPDVNGIAEIRDRDGSLLYRHAAEPAPVAVGPRAVAGMDALMSEVVRGGTGKAARLDRPAAGKTGTSQDYRDAWFVGFTADDVAGVWLGNDDGTPMHKVVGGGEPASLWRQVMLAAHAGFPPRPLRGAAAPDGPANQDWASGGLESGAETVLRRMTGG